MRPPAHAKSEAKGKWRRTAPDVNAACLGRGDRSAYPWGVTVTATVK
jgi:hypothetical protein